MGGGGSQTRRLQELWVTQKACSGVSVEENAKRVNYADWKVNKYALIEGGQTLAVK